MTKRLARIVWLHLVDRVRRHTTGTARSVVATIVLTGWVGFSYGTTVLALRQPGAADGAGAITVFTAVMVCLFAGAIVAVEGVRPGGKWTRLAFFPLNQARIAAIVLSENVILTLAVLTVWVTPGLLASLQLHAIRPAVMPIYAATTLALSVAIVASTTLFGLLASRIVGLPWLRRHAQELVAFAVVLLNWIDVMGFFEMTRLHGVHLVMRHLPAPAAMELLGNYFAGEHIPQGLVLKLMAWAVVPCVALVFVPLRRPVPAADVKRARRVRTRERTDAPIVRGRVSLPRETLRRFHVQFLREPTLGRSAILITIAMFALASMFAGMVDHAPLQVPGGPNVFFLEQIRSLRMFPVLILISGLFVVATMLASLVLPLEKSHVVFLRLSSRPLRRLFAYGQAAALVYPMLSWVLAVVFVGSHSSGQGLMLPCITLGVAAVLLGNAFGMLTGVLYGRYDWRRAIGATEFPARIVSVIALFVVARGSRDLMRWCLEPVSTLAVAGRGAVIVAAAVTAAIACTILSTKLFRRRRPDQLAVRTGAEE